MPRNLEVAMLIGAAVATLLMGAGTQVGLLLPILAPLAAAVAIA